LGVTWSILFDAAYEEVMRQVALWLVNQVTIRAEEVSTAVWVIETLLRSDVIPLSGSKTCTFSDPDITFGYIAWHFGLPGGYDKRFGAVERLLHRNGAGVGLPLLPLLSRPGVLLPPRPPFVPQRAGQAVALPRCETSLGGERGGKEAVGAWSSANL
jgi:hypothetical protein